MSQLGKFLGSAAKAGVWVAGQGLKVWERGEFEDSDRERFQYDELPAAPSIRLLKVESEGGRRLRCSLETFELDEAPQYHALSYTWGDPFSLPNHEISSVSSTIASPFQQQKYKGSPCKIMICNNARLTIGLNLYEALTRLSRPESRDLVPHRYIWADAICINQADKSEQTAQMLLMGRIYSQAASVIVWLGEELEETERALSVINKMSKLTVSQLSSMVGLPIFTDSTYATLGIPVISYQEWRAFFGFGRRGWFMRVWVVQEVFFATSHVYVAGSRRIAGDDLYRISILLVHSGWTEQIEAKFEPEVYENTGPRLGSAAAIYQMKEQIKTPGQLKPTNILASIRFRKATEKVDYIYAMLNVIAVTQNLKPEQLPIQPTPGARLETVLEAATLLCLKDDQNLTVLSAVQEREARPRSWSCPSWTVDWTKSMTPEPLSTLSRGNNVWKPSGTMLLEIPDTSTAHTLKFRACKLCEIVDVSMHGEEMINRNDMGSLIDVALSTIGPYKGPTGQSLTEALWRTCLADIVEGSTPAPERAGRGWMYKYIQTVALQAGRSDEKFRARYGILERQISNLRKKDPQTFFPSNAKLKHIAEAFFERSEECAPWLEDIQYYARSSAKSLHGRRLAVFNNNHVGLAPRYAKQGDTVCIIPGMRTPFALKHVDDNRYEILGEAYVHGLMFGEGFNSQLPLKFDNIELQ